MTRTVAPHELLPRAAELAQALGGLPSRNRLMAELNVGARKATAVRELLVRALPAGPTVEPTPTSALNPGPTNSVTPDPLRAGGFGPKHHPDSVEPTAPSPGSTNSNPVPQIPDPEPSIADPSIEPANLGPEQAESNTAPPNPGAVPSDEADPPAGQPDAEAQTAAKVLKPPRVWPVILLALPAFVAIWSGWVGLGRLTGFGKVDLLPGIVEPGGVATLDTAITLPIGVETYAAYALHVWLSPAVPVRARWFARWSAIGSLAFGAAGQVAYHLLTAAGVTAAPWQITTLVACLPVAVLGMGAALAHLLRTGHQPTGATQ